jgi:hypothetical protein
MGREGRGARGEGGTRRKGFGRVKRDWLVCQRKEKHIRQ